MAKMWYSRKYDNSPMPNSIFFVGGYAIHGTNHVKGLGRPASHGCVRLHPSNAQILYRLVQARGAGNTQHRPDRLRRASSASRGLAWWLADGIWE